MCYVLFVQIAHCVMALARVLYCRGDFMAFADKARTIQYNREYNEQNYERLAVTVAKGGKEQIQTAADAAGQSVNEYIRQAIAERLCQQVDTI